MKFDETSNPIWPLKKKIFSVHIFIDYQYSFNQSFLKTEKSKKLLYSCKKCDGNKKAFRANFLTFSSNT